VPWCASTKSTNRFVNPKPRTRVDYTATGQTITEDTISLQVDSDDDDNGDVVITSDGDDEDDDEGQDDFLRVLGEVVGRESEGQTDQSMFYEPAEVLQNRDLMSQIFPLNRDSLFHTYY